MMNTPGVILLWNSACANRDLVGGKAAALHACVRAGFHVPQALVVTTDAWRSRESERISQQVRADIHDVCVAMMVDSFAVRSSAVVEDGNSAAWAGQFESHLSVSLEEVVVRVERCMESGKKEAPRLYGATRAIDVSQVPIAVIVQEMVPAQYAGVLFTQNPVTKDAGEMLVEVVEGLGSALVGGLVTPDTYSVDRVSREVTVMHSTHNQSLLSEEQVRELVAVGISIEKLFGTAQDIEWAYSEGVFWILQSRPITTL